VPVQVQNKPGQLFRSILAGAILGAGAGTANAEHNAGSGWGAAGAGAAAAQKGAQQQQQQRQQQAQQQFENQQKVQKEDREQKSLDQQKVFNDAQIANWHVQATVEQHNSDRADQKYLDQKNAANKTLFDSLQQAGAKAPTDIPPVMSAYDLSKEYMKTQGKVAQSPLGFHRIFIDTTSGDNVEFNASDPSHPRWVDTDSGKDVDMTGKTEFKVLDVPNNTMNQRTPIKNSDVFKLLGEKVPGMDPNNTQMLSPADMLTLASKNREIGLEKQRVANETRQMNIARFNAANETAERDIDSINKQIQEEKNKALPNQNKLNELNDSLKATKDWIDKQYYDIWGAKAPKTLPVATGGGAVAHPDVLTILGQVPGFDPQIAQKFANLSPDEMVTQVLASKLPSDVKNQILKAIDKPLIVSTPPNPNAWKPGTPYTMQNLGTQLNPGVSPPPSGSSTGAPLPQL
jgi:hypothetical protein